MSNRISAEEIGEGFDGVCPVCHGDTFKARIDHYVTKPGVPKYILTCCKCGESGDFLDVNDYIFKSQEALQSSVSVKDTVEVLNTALKADSDALTALLSVRVACREELCKETGITCRKRASGDGKTAVDVGFLDVLRGVLGEPRLNYTVEDNRKISGFFLDNGPGGVVH
jgi:hypothetical protein